ncbi:hypothetical protein AQUCO_07900005v1 [Aquilegia coerulea]|uniref:Sulfotransferase n=1 Tax=Aquilegia coerulea TaxID=218851 RepID=A0A2G5C7S3_AQUCA|nr:hypothetical protein AQUCO_07900005v1 [Aquilegia coerulea]
METTQTIVSATSDSQEIKQLLSQLPKTVWFEEYDIYQQHGSWYLAALIESTLTTQQLFQARDDDIIIATPPKAGTTWLKSLIPSIVNCPKDGDDVPDPLVKNNPHMVVRTLEISCFNRNQNPDLSTMPSPRIFHTHLPYNALPDSIKNSQCKIVYMARNPKDAFVSLWHFTNRTRTSFQGPYPIEKAFESFCNGSHPFGPYLDHVLDYWNESLIVPEKILFLTYEEMKRNPKQEVGKLASFVGKSLANDGELDNVLWRSSFDRLKNLEVNKTGSEPHTGLAYNSFFRLGTIGDWKNYFTPEMQQRLNQIANLKFEGSGLDLDI